MRFGIRALLWFVAIIALVIWFVLPLPVNRKLMDQVQSGMTAVEVQEMVGPPHWKSHRESGEDWFYWMSFKTNFSVIELDPNDRVIKHWKGTTDYNAIGGLLGFMAIFAVILFVFWWVYKHLD